MKAKSNLFQKVFNTKGKIIVTVLILLLFIIGAGVVIAYQQNSQNFSEPAATQDKFDFIGRESFVNENKNLQTPDNSVVRPATSLQTYFEENVNRDLTDYNQLENFSGIDVKQTLVDRTKSTDNPTLDSIWFGDDVDAFLSMYDNPVVLYNLDNNSDYAVGYVNTMAGKITDYVFANNNYNGEKLDNCIYDSCTGIVYIPKSQASSKDVITNQLQLVSAVVPDSDLKLANSINVKINNQYEENIDKDIVPNAFDTQFKIPVGTINEQNIKIIANDEQDITNNCCYNNGELTVNLSPVNVLTLQIVTAPGDGLGCIKIGPGSMNILPSDRFKLNDSYISPTVGACVEWGDYIQYWNEWLSGSPSWYNAYLYGPNGFSTQGDLDNFKSIVWDGVGGVDLNTMSNPSSYIQMAMYTWGICDYCTAGSPVWSNPDCLPLKCGHIGTPVSHGPAENSQRSRILAINENEGYAVIGVCSKIQGATNQGGCGVFKVPYECNGGIQMSKDSTCAWSKTNPNYSYVGSVYDIYNDYSKAQNDDLSGVVKQITVDENGNAATGIHDMKKGQYYVKENPISHGTNYLRNSEIGSVYVNPNVMNDVIWPVSGVKTTYDTPADDPAPVKIIKTDAQTGKEITEGYVPSFAGAYYDYEYFTDSFNTLNPDTYKEDHKDTYQRHWVMETDSKGMTSLEDDYKHMCVKELSDDFYYNEGGGIVCPIGSYVVHEIKAPEGYIISEKYYIIQVIPSKTAPIGATTKIYDAQTGTEMAQIYDPNTGTYRTRLQEQVKKADFNFDKQTDIQGKAPERLTKIPFKVTSTTTGEWHVVVTDLNACVDTSSSQCLHTNNTNYFDQLLDNNGAIPSGGINEAIIDKFYSTLDNHAGVWFCYDKEKGDYKKGKTTLPDAAKGDNDLGAMPYDTYILEELPVSSNSDYILVKQEFTIDVPDTNIDLGTLLNRLQPDAYVETIATSQTGEKTIELSENAVINDRVRYGGTAIQPGKSYKLKSWIVDANSQKQLSEVVETNFKPEHSEGYEDVKISLNTLGLVGKKLSCFEELFDENNNLLAQHKEVSDLYQAVSVSTPDLYTNLYEFGTHSKIIDGRSNTTELQDYITYTGLTDGDSYKLKCNILDKTTKKVLSEAQSTFIAQSKGSGTTDIYITVDTTSFTDNHDLVAFEYLYKGEDLLAQHVDIDDSNQTVKIKVPKGSLLTYASDSASGSSVLPVTDDACVRDRVVYTGLEAGYSYKLKAKLMDKETAQPLIVAGQEITGEKQFQIEGKGVQSGEESVSLNVDTRALQGKNIVVFEKLYQSYDGAERLVATHENILDINQTVTVEEAKCKTLLLDSVSGKKVISRAQDTKVTDTISYSGLVAGNTYTIESSIVDKASKRTLGESVSSFVAMSDNGDTSVDMNITTLDLSKNSEIVAYERIYLDGVCVCSHVDINDKDQTLTIGKAALNTNLHLKDNYTHVIPRSRQVELSDGIDYEGLSIGQRFNIYGKLVDKDGNDFIDSSGNTVEYSGSFIADSTGKTIISYTLDSSNIADGTKLISFVEVSVDDALICAHKDLSDENQTVTVVVSTIDIATSARGKISEQKEIYCVDDEAIIDSVSYHGAEPGYEYKLRARVIDKTTVKSIQPLNAVAGTDYVEKRFIASNTGFGKEDVQIDIDTRLLQDKTLVVYEELYDHTGVCRATHQDLDDYSQTVKTNQPAIETDLYQKSDGSQIMQRYAEQHLIDKITYKNLCVRHDYELSGVLINKGTGDVYINEVTGEPVKASNSFRPASQDGCIDKLEYVFDSTLLSPDTELVSFVTLTQNKGDLLSHCVIDDQRETVKVVTPIIKTNIYDPETGEQSFIACRDKQINDDITWNDLPKDRVVQVYGWLVNHETGVPVHDGQLSENEAIDTILDLVDALGGRMRMSNNAEYPSRWEVFFTESANKVNIEKLKNIDLEKLGHISFATNEIPISESSGKDSFVSKFNYGVTPAQKAVAMNIVVSENTVVANHVDIEDKDEAIDILRSEIKTSLTDSSKEKSVDPSSETMLVDTVSYKNCIVGKEYELEGHLVRKSDGSIIASNRVKFIPDSVDGEMSISFILDTNSLANTDIVAYEYLYLDSDLSCMHEDINDSDQTIHVNNIVESALKALGVKTGDSPFWIFLLVLMLVLAALIIALIIDNRKYGAGNKEQEVINMIDPRAKKEDSQPEVNFQEIKSEVIEEEINLNELAKDE